MTRASAITGSSARLKEQLLAVAGKAKLAIEIGYVSSAMVSFLPELIGKIHRELPALCFYFFELVSDAQIKGLQDSKIDIGFFRSWFDSPELRAEVLAEETLSAMYKRGGETPAGSKNLQSLQNAPCVKLAETSAPGIAELIQTILDRATNSPHASCETDQVDSVMRLVSAGLGWSIVPTLAIKGAGEGMASFQLMELPERKRIVAATRTDDDPNISAILKLARCFFDS